VAVDARSAKGTPMARRRIGPLLCVGIAMVATACGGQARTHDASTDSSSAASAATAGNSGPATASKAPRPRHRRAAHGSKTTAPVHRPVRVRHPSASSSGRSGTHTDRRAPDAKPAPEKAPTATQPASSGVGRHPHPEVKVAPVPIVPPVAGAPSPLGHPISGEGPRSIGNIVVAPGTDVIWTSTAPIRLQFGTPASEYPLRSLRGRMPLLSGTYTAVKVLTTGTWTLTLGAASAG